ncbi:uncharacterized protein FOMMEDRAFT_150725 [Fomitiporia mediterranea MF3/22]|uniref:uncharacterized protein n=1 Tax=Fomitiporia mediterranea (strain MF3/22) TaxID=694068 RepID=UPI0004408CAF|nr:uncharacterized protein FOMMEDRAFT_150725 [Fomitiporia mediterranea MF3/22]EJD08054.1 hypothetical protein FOMMEDRAFT_150725 [Fomitiporia mediterranea MF3/22]
MQRRSRVADVDTHVLYTSSYPCPPSAFEANHGVRWWKIFARITTTNSPELTEIGLHRIDVVFHLGR